MNWHTATVAATELAPLLTRIHNAGGTITCSTPGADQVRVTWTTTAPADHRR